ncbi:hypothetical protein [Pelotomaculum schinkii]|uniref:hypothetical protein n=1 Tax=Pelotomaculum schinkii TaxID=78350 RepID=UPI00167EAE81|nr:hypothetical protein [Pelotomaculum schinkii]
MDIVRHDCGREKVRRQLGVPQRRCFDADYNGEQNSLKERIPQAVERVEKLQASIANVSTNEIRRSALIILR